MTRFDEWVGTFIEEYGPDNHPLDMPTVNERQAMSDYLDSRISVEEAAVAYTRDIAREKTSGDPWFLIEKMAQDLPETQSHLVDLVKVIKLLPNEHRVSGKVQH